MIRLLGSLLFLSVVSLLFSNCSNKDSQESFDGVWKSIGYGQIIQIADSTFTISDLTDISCLPVMEGHLSIFGNHISIDNDTLNYKDGINLYQYIRLGEAPSVCQIKPSDEQLHNIKYNYDVLSHYFNDHYAYFELRGVNWDSLNQVTKNKLEGVTSESHFYNIVEDMLDSFNDGHISLEAPDSVTMKAQELREIESQEEASNLKSYGDFEIARLVADHYLGSNDMTRRSRVMRWGKISDDVGYLQVNLMMGHALVNLSDFLEGGAYWQAYFSNFEETTSEEHTQQEVQGINSTLDQVFEDLKQTSAIVLDVRFNGGGKDEVAMEIIKRFNPKTHDVFTKKGKYKDGFTKPNRVILQASQNSYLKPVYLLTSQQSASATEIMVLSSLNLKNITRVGSHTEGVFSDVLDKVLPNQWEVGLSSEIYLDNEGNNYEGIGIPPHIELSYPLDRQDFFRQVAADLDADLRAILEVTDENNHFD